MKFFISKDWYLETNPGQFICCGYSHDHKDGVNFQLSGKEVKWVAVKGGMGDWAIYFADLDKTLDWIKKHGYKLLKEDVRNLVDVSDEVLANYRR